MSWITIAWSMASAVCATLAFVHFGFDRGSRIARLLFALTALAASAEAISELWMLKATSVEGYASWLRASFVATSFLVISMVWYTRTYFGKGRLWVAAAATGLWILVLIADAVSRYGPAFESISGLQTFQTPWGEPFARANGVLGPLSYLVSVADLSVLVFVLDLAAAYWRRGNRRRAVLVGAGVGTAVLLAAVLARMADAGILPLPYLTPFIFLGAVLVLGFPLWSDVARVTELENRARTATNAATQADDLLHEERGFLRQLIDINPNLIFAKDRQGRFTLVNQAVADLYGTTVDGLIGKTDADFNSNPEEVEMFRKADLEVMDTLQERFIPEERITDAAGRFRWFQTVKRPVLSHDGTADHVLGTATDITRRKHAELELEQQRNELAHLSRVTMLGELSGSLAHELNQPLTAILSNAQAALRFLASNPADIDEVRGILKDIVEDDKHAGEVIRRLRLLLKKGEVNLQPLDLGEVVQDVLKIMRSDLVNQGVDVGLDLAPDLPVVHGDRVQMQQVLLNLVLNGCDAMAETRAAERRLTVRTQRDDGSVRVSVSDRGCGIPEVDAERIFEPFFTTKAHGMGLGLAVCRTILTAHGGRLWAEAGPGSGTTVLFTLPAGERALS